MKKFALAWCAVTVLAVAVLVPAPRVEAQEPDLTEQIADGCKAVPSSMLGTVTGAIGFGGDASPWGTPLLGFVGGGAALNPATLAGTPLAAGGGAAAGVGGTTLTAGTLGAYLLAFAGGFCAGSIGIQWLRDFRSAEYARLNSIPEGTVIGSLSRRVPCSSVGITSGLDCTVLGVWEPTVVPTDVVPASPEFGSYSQFYGDPFRPTSIGTIKTYVDNWSSANGGAEFPSFSGRPYTDFDDIPVPSNHGSMATRTAPSGSGILSGAFGALWVGSTRTLSGELAMQYDCTGRGPACGITPGTRQYLSVWRSGFADFRLLPAFPVDLDMDINGYHRKLRQTLECWRIGSGSAWEPVTRVVLSSAFRDSDEGPDEWDPQPCLEGEIPKAMKLERGNIGTGGTIGSFETITEIQITPTNPATSLTTDQRQALTVGELSPFPREAGDSVELLQGAFPSEYPTTETPPTTTPPTTTTVPGAGSGQPGTPADFDDPDGGGDECWPSGWGIFNPLEWVYRPILCAMRWLFVPPEDFGDRLEAFTDTYREDAPFQWAAGGVEMVQDSTVSFVRWSDADLPCPAFLGADFCLADLDSWTLPFALRAAFLVGLWFLLAYAVVRFL